MEKKIKLKLSRTTYIKHADFVSKTSSSLDPPEVTQVIKKY